MKNLSPIYEEVPDMLALRQSLRQFLSLRQSMGETIGDIPMYSLHRIKNRLSGHRGLIISADMKKVLCECLIKANEIYKKESGNDWSCLTSHNLIYALEYMDRKSRVMVNLIKRGQPREMRSQVQEVLSALQEHRESDIQKIKQWFVDMAEEIQYDTSGRIPWAIVRSLRKDLSFWVTTKISLFHNDIEDAILQVAEEEGIRTDDAEDAWKRMGGKIYDR